MSVGLPLDLLVYQADALRVTRFVQIDHSNQYFAMIRDTWGETCEKHFVKRSRNGTCESCDY